MLPVIYRPIDMVSVIMKVMENAINIELIKHFENINITVLL